VITSTLSFADVDPRTLNMDPASVEAAITERTKAIVAVDMFGYPCELDELRELAGRHGLAVIEDSAEALGAEYKGVPVGGHGVPAIFGFYPNKQLATGEGGVVTTHDEETFQLVVSMRNQGRQYAGGGWFDHVRLGFNYRWTDIQAAVGIGQLEKLDRILALRTAAAARYGELLAGLDGVETLIGDDAEHKRSWFVYVVKLAPELDRDGVMAALRRDGVATAEYVPCIHLQEYMRRDYGFREGQFPVAEDTSRRTLALPFFPQIEPEDQERVVDVLRGAVERG
jgi:perosamine synthetase